MKPFLFKLVVVFFVWPCISAFAQGESLSSLRVALGEDWKAPIAETDEEFEAYAKTELGTTYDESEMDEKSIQSMAKVLRENHRWFFLNEEFDLATLESIYSDEALLNKVRGTK